jgi:hypothetical protein
VVYGAPFDFVESRIVQVPIGLEALSLGEFRDAVSQIDESAIYYHLLEARVRLGRRRNDFSAWLAESLELPGLAAKVQSLDPYVGGLEALRAQIVGHCVCWRQGVTRDGRAA